MSVACRRKAALRRSSGDRVPLKSDGACVKQRPVLRSAPLVAVLLVKMCRNARQILRVRERLHSHVGIRVQSFALVVQCTDGVFVAERGEHVMSMRFFAQCLRVYRADEVTTHVTLPEA